MCLLHEASIVFCVVVSCLSAPRESGNIGFFCVGFVSFPGLCKCSVGVGQVVSSLFLPIIYQGCEREERGAALLGLGFFFPLAFLFE